MCIRKKVDTCVKCGAVDISIVYEEVVQDTLRPGVTVSCKSIGCSEATPLNNKLFFNDLRPEYMNVFSCKACRMNPSPQASDNAPVQLPSIASILAPTPGPLPCLPCATAEQFCKFTPSQRHVSPSRARCDRCKAFHGITCIRQPRQPGASEDKRDTSAVCWRCVIDGWTCSWTREPDRARCDRCLRHHFKCDYRWTNEALAAYRASKPAARGRAHPAQA